MCCGEEALEVEDLLNHPLHSYYFAPAVDVVPHFEGPLPYAATAFDLSGFFLFFSFFHHTVVDCNFLLFSQQY